MKGLELPINMIIVVAIAVLVLVVVAAFFSGQFLGNTDVIAVNKAFNEGCNSLRTVFNCDPGKVGEVITSYKATATSNEATLLVVCGLKDKTLENNPNLCAQACGCVTGA